MNLHQLFQEFVERAAVGFTREARLAFDRAGLPYPGLDAATFKCSFQQNEFAGPRLFARVRMEIAGETWSALFQTHVPTKGRISDEHLDRCAQDIRERCLADEK